MNKRITLHANFTRIDEYNNFIFKYYYPDTSETKDKLNKKIAKLYAKHDEFVHLPNNASGFKAKMTAITQQQKDDILQYKDSQVIVIVEIKYYKFKKPNGEVVQGYRLLLLGIVPHESK